MKILLNNDDGIDSLGLQSLVKPLSALGEVFVCAPMFQQSAKSHSITIHGHYAIEKREIPFAKEAYAVDGTPVDVTEIALGGLNIKPDLVISGINNGLNCGHAAIYSGTLGVAREAIIRGIPSIAVSLDFTSSKEGLYEELIKALIDFIPEYLNWEKNREYFVSLNLSYENLTEKKSLGKRWTKFAYKSRYDNSFVLKDNYMEEDYLGYIYDESEKNLDYDWYATEQGYITYTPMGLNVSSPGSVCELGGSK